MRFEDTLSAADSISIYRVIHTHIALHATGYIFIEFSMCHVIKNRKTHVLHEFPFYPESQKTCVISNTYRETAMKLSYKKLKHYKSLLYSKCRPHLLEYRGKNVLLKQCYANRTQLRVTFKSFELGFRPPVMTWHILSQSAPCCFAHFTVNWTFRAYGGRIVYDVSEEQGTQENKKKKNRQNFYVLSAARSECEWKMRWKTRMLWME